MTEEQVLENIRAAQEQLAALARAPIQHIGDLREALENLNTLLAEITFETGWSQTEAASHQGESQSGADNLQQLWTSSTDYVYTVTIKDGRSVNTIHGPGCAAVTGYTAREYASDPYLWFHMIHKEDRKLVLEQANRALAGKETSPVEHRILHKDGSLRWIRNAPVPRYDEHARLIAYDGLITDITERKKNEMYIRESESKYRALFEASLDAIFLESLQGRILDCNPAACSLLGYEKGELLNMDVADLLPPEIANNLPAVISKELVDGGIIMETFNRRKDGQLIACEISTRLIAMSGEQRVIAFVHDLTERNLAEKARLGHMEAETRAAAAETAWQIMEKEVTERRQVEVALRESEKRYRTLVDTSPDAIFYISPEMRVIFCNQRAAELYGAENPGQMLGMNVLYLFGLENYPWIPSEKEIAHFAKDWGVRGQELTLTKKDGSHFPAEVGASLVVNEQDEPIGIICIVRDITIRKSMEQFMVRTERLTALGKISAELAHEIKNPLQSVQSNLELVLDYALDPQESQAHLRLCYQELERLVDLTNRLLKQANQNDVAAKPAAIPELLERTLMLLENSSRDAGVHTNLQVPDKLPLITVDPDQLIQVLLNLSINAIEAMPLGGELTLEVDTTDRGILLNIINDGNISQAGFENIFEPFYTTKSGGTGLGLPISYNIIQKMGGSLNAVNLQNPDRVKFTVTLPDSLVIPADQSSSLPEESRNDDSSEKTQ
ncbi:MAG: PAS domain S-box protein [Chloroflexi bacterium]|nr:PAS domain S-box protein [Chloroflexota bacterium]